MIKLVKSSDPRKPTVIAALKAKANCRKVTNVVETETHYMGNAMWFNPGESGAESILNDKGVQIANVRVSKEIVTERMLSDD